MIKLFLVFILLFSPNTFALDIFGRDLAAGGSGSKVGLVALYNFKSTRGNGTAIPNNIIADESGVGTPLDLTINDLTRANKTCSEFVFDPVSNQLQSICSLDLIAEGAVARSLAATKIATQCQATNEVQVEVWLKNDRDDDPRIRNLLVPLKIVTMGVGVGATETVNGVTSYRGGSNDGNFFLGYTYNNAAQYLASVRTGNRQTRAAMANDGLVEFNRYRIETSHTSTSSGDMATNKILEKEKFQHIIFNRNARGEVRLYVSSASLTAAGSVPVLRSQVAGPSANTFSGWGANSILAIGNETTAGDTDAPRISNNSGNRTESRNWRGQIYMVAVYCRAHTDVQILGAAAPDAAFPVIPPNPNVTVTDLHTQAAQLYTRLTGVKIPVTAPIISGVNDDRIPQYNVAKGMVQFLQESQPLQAALLATKEDSFYNTTVRDFAKRMSTRDETVNTPLNDFVATIVGVAANEKDARLLLNGNFYYMGNPSTTALPNDLQRDLLTSNNHYAAMERSGYNLRRILKRVDGQKIYSGTTIVDHPDPAGIITSRAFMEAHAVAGTNRRLVEFTFREFACIPIAGWADSTGPDNYIGRDVDRFPGGDHTKFLTTCRSCHSNMDGLRGAFAKFNFSDGFVKYAPLMPVVTDPDDENATNMCQSPAGIACKMNRNNDTFPGGFAVNDDSWINNANRNSNTTYFGWGTTLSGRGVRSLASMVASSKAFPKCMAKRAFRSVCKREVTTFDSSLIDRVSTDFVNEQYDLERLFARIAISRECIGSGIGQ
ncbi:MAG: hypothetical protein A4S09_15890 [Proteobacteria bacterium SG_bin7]|nr:MAG: hypothetical protein A4S09_15890 [Proteobacteria bacterium SG_bin7]